MMTLHVTSALAFISNTVIQHATEGKYVHLEEFLPINQWSASDSSRLHINEMGEFSHKLHKYYHSISSFSAWLKAWNKFERILVSTDISLYHGLVTYRELIQECNSKFQWAAVYAYDRRFRAQLGLNKSFEYGAISHDLYTIILDKSALYLNIQRCHRCHSTNHLVKHCPFRKAQPPSLKRKGTKVIAPAGCEKSTPLSITHNDRDTTAPSRDIRPAPELLNDTTPSAGGNAQGLHKPSGSQSA